MAFVGLATLALMIGHLRRNAERRRIREVPLGRGLVVTAGVLSGVILLVAAFVFVTFPRVSQGWAGRGETLATSVSGFSDEISIGEHGSTILANPEIVLRVEFPAGEPSDMAGLHWRGRSYDRFDGTRWTRSGSLPPSSAPRAWYSSRWSGPLIEQKIFGAALDVRVLFSLHPTVDIEPENGVQPLFDNAGDFIYWGSGAPAYTASSRTTPPPPSELRAAEGGYTPSSRYYLQLPTLDERIAALADSLTAGLETRYDKTVAIQRWLQSFGYTRDLPPTAREATLEHFLFERRAGHCEYFSTAMVVLLRSLGIQARNVNGFLGGQWSEFGNYLVITQNEAHSWVEVWFPRYGWVTFDPTPADTGSLASAVWFWPGKIFFDAIQHRWNKWVLDYSVDSQSGPLARWSDFVAERELEAAGTAANAERRMRFVGAGLLLLLIAAGYLRARAAGQTLAEPTRMYLQLRNACSKSGLGVSSGLTPLALVERVRQKRAAATHPSERVVDLYLRSRYGRQTLREWELREMREALAVARRMLRTSG